MRVKCERWEVMGERGLELTSFSPTWPDQARRRRRTASMRRWSSDAVDTVAARFSLAIRAMPEPDSA